MIWRVGGRFAILEQPKHLALPSPDVAQWLSVLASVGDRHPVHRAVRRSAGQTNGGVSFSTTQTGVSLRLRSTGKHSLWHNLLRRVDIGLDSRSTRRGFC